jgi:predicted phage terminase large subunit-like protein
VGVETAGPQKGLLQNLREVFPPDIPLAGHTPERDKLTRALPWFARANSGQVRLARGAWNAAFLDECQAFPLGAHDDQVDAVSGAHALLFGPLVPSPTVLRAGRLPEALAARRQRSVTL